MRTREPGKSSAEPDDATESEILLGEIRASFYEWQGGNQFVGPNTSIRAEPSDAKDDIASDGRTYTFHGVPVTGAQERGGYVHVPYLGARDVVAPAGRGGAETLFASCERNKIPTSTFLPKGVYSPNARR
ncbi:hypothetical protein [Streptomyces sp. NPDC098101]|uniref:hypothetical protein n=1 Tax=Streptomyces sp. NPDC098101 TaxID=3366096 RepID=UPI0037FF552E